MTRILSIIFRTILRNIFRFACLIATLLRPGHFDHSQRQDGTLPTLRDKLFWIYKYYFKQIEKPEQNCGIAEHFSAQRFDFALPDGFRREAEASLAAGGDILVSDHVRGDNTGCLWDDVAPFFFDADISCANLESPVAPSQPFTALPKNLLKKLELNNSPEVFERCFQRGRGITLFTTANNHALDRGESGLLETLDFLDQRGAYHTGTFRSRAERDDILVIEKNGIRFAFLSYTFSLNENKLPPGKEYLVNLLPLNRPGCDTWPIREDAERARKEKSADIVSACLHWSLEHESYPLRHFIDLGHEVLECGVDVIIGNHSHTLQPAEKYTYTDPRTGLRKDGLVFYALGDLLSWHPSKNSRLNALAKIRFTKGFVNGRKTTLISGAELKPLYAYSKIRLEHCGDFRLLDLMKTAEAIEKGGDVQLFLSAKDRREITRLKELAVKLMPGILHRAYLK
ncbi:MAG: CapA family protein [Spirochaetaceae bacterium]|jgi:poly-gamma-glutamate synthesis protein (capsule biosynthesis protein)|nr:CapA family protein [Spirochaetaceae bacterium]